MQKKAEKALKSLVEILETGGEPAEWVREQITNLLNELKKTA